MPHRNAAASLHDPGSGLPVSQPLADKPCHVQGQVGEASRGKRHLAERTVRPDASAARVKRAEIHRFAAALVADIMQTSTKYPCYMPAHDIRSWDMLVGYNRFAQIDLTPSCSVRANSWLTIAVLSKHFQRSCVMLQLVGCEAHAEDMQATCWLARARSSHALGAPSTRRQHRKDSFGRARYINGDHKQ